MSFKTGQQGSRAFTLVELLVCIAIIVTLVAIFLLGLAAVRRKGRQHACAMNIRGLHAGMMMYAAENNSCLPPFAFSSMIEPDIVQSGHWGGCSQKADPEGGLGRKGVDWVNLWLLVQCGLVSDKPMICPDTDIAATDGMAGYFPYTTRQSSYCLRFPFSRDLFTESPPLMSYGGGSLLDVYRMLAGGQPGPLGNYKWTIPQVKMGQSYSTALSDPPGDGEYDTFPDAMLCDGFWWQGLSQPAPPPSKDLQTYPARTRWSHGGKFNVASGDGSVRAIEDRDGVIAGNSNPAGGRLIKDGAYYATYAERVWQFFDANK